MNAIDKARKLVEKDVARQEKKDQEKDDQKIVEVSFFENGEIILEQIKDATLAPHATRYMVGPQKNDFAFLCLDKKTNDIKIVESYEIDNITYKPIVNKIALANDVKLPTGVEEYGTTNDLLTEIKEYLLYYFDPPKLFEEFLPCYVLFTWVYDRFPFIPYIHFLGLTGTGKTTAAETVSTICYKSIDAGGSMSMASMFRLVDQWRGTIFLDEFELGNMGADAVSGMINFLKAGSSERKIFRVEGEKTREVMSYLVKAPKIFTSEQPFKGAGLQSRTILVQMEKARRLLPLYKLDNYQDKAVSLRNKLMLWRLRNINNIDLKKMEHGIPELQTFDRRVQQIITPIYFLADEKAREKLLEFAKRQEEETRRERLESFEGRIFEKLYYLYTTGEPVTLGEIKRMMDEEQEASGGYKSKVSEKRIGDVVRKIFNLDIKRLGHKNISTVMINDNNDRFKDLIVYFGGIGVLRVASVAGVADEEELPLWEEPPI